MNKDRTPCTKYSFVSSDTWDTFVQMKTTDEFQQQSAAHKAIQAKNIHPHRLGTAGYAGKHPVWLSEDNVAIQSQVSLPFAEIIDERANAWLRARATITSSGTITFKNPEDEVVSQRLVRYVELPSC